METSLLLQYLFVLLMLVFMEGILSADNALVLAVMVKHLPGKERGHALFYGLLGAVILRFGALFAISFLANVWEAQAIGAAYLIFVGAKNLYRYYSPAYQEYTENKSDDDVPHTVSRKEFWLTVCRVELADVAFAVDSILAAVALAMALPDMNIGHIGGMDAGKFMVILIGGLAGVVIMRFAAQFFVTLLDKHPKLEVAAFLLVLWVGIKLVIVTLSHPALQILPESFPENPYWHTLFFGVMIAIALWGWFTAKTNIKVRLK